MNQHQQQQLLFPPQQPVPITNEDIYMRVLAIGDSQQNDAVQPTANPWPPPTVATTTFSSYPITTSSSSSTRRTVLPPYTIYVLPVGGFVPKPSTEQQREHSKKVAREHVFQLLYSPVCSLDAEKVVYVHNVCRDAATRLGEAVINAYDRLDQGINPLTGTVRPLVQGGLKMDYKNSVDLTVSHTDPVVFSVPSSLHAAVSSSSSSSSHRSPPQQLNLYQDNRRPSIIPATRPLPSPSSSTSSTSTTQSHRPKKEKQEPPIQS
ncbi:hypothetical protein INT45_002567 [Circinella minor]|uniref:Uncharacterized protein n=1 Tax=Circinella minor TaxID=1195481 RepID=A0A8H7RS42_9FUNG|nr:hypothetical protein INT45_002567 [Circinella minor]